MHVALLLDTRAISFLFLSHPIPPLLFLPLLSPLHLPPSLSSLTLSYPIPTLSLPLSFFSPPQFHVRPQTSSWRELPLKMADFDVLHLNELSIALITAVDRKKVYRHAPLLNSCLS